MSISGKTIAKNASFLMFSQMVTWVLALLLSVFLPRYLGVDTVGKFYVAGAIWSIIGVLATFGMDTYLIKATARSPEQAASLLGTSIAVRIVLFLVGCIAVALYLSLFPQDTSTIYVIILLGVANLLIFLGGAVGSILQGLELMAYVSLANIVSKGVNTALCIGVILLGFGLNAIATVSILSALVSLAVLWYGLQRYRRLPITATLLEVKPMLANSLPFLIVSLTLAAYQQINTLTIASLIDERSVGWYSTAGTLFGTLLFVPTVMATAVFPAMSRSYSVGEGADGFTKLTRRSFDLMLIISIPMAFGLVAVSDNLVVVLYGQEFGPAGTILAIMGLALPSTYLNILIAQTLMAADRPGLWTKTMILATVLMLIFSVILVPWSYSTFGNGSIGGALSFLITELGMTVAGMFFLPRSLLGWSNVRSATLTSIAGLVMLAVCWWLRDMFLAVPVLVGVVTYTALVFALRILPAEDLRILREVAQQLWKRIRPGASVTVGASGR